MSVVNFPNPLTRRREYLRSPIARKVGGPLKAMSFLMSTQVADFSPAGITSLAHWYDATEISGSDGDAIGTWADQEGTDDLTQATSSAKPTLKTNQINGKQVVRTDGSDDFMDVAFTEISHPVHIFTVIKYRGATSISNDKRMHASEAETGHTVFYLNAPASEFAMFSGSAVVGPALDNSAHIWGLLYDGANSVLRQDGAQNNTGDVGNNAGLNGFSIAHIPGGGQNTNADFAELLIYNAELSATDRDDVESYLSDKWGVTI